jgi:hypothetical protein
MQIALRQPLAVSEKLRPFWNPVKTKNPARWATQRQLKNVAVAVNR